MRFKYAFFGLLALLITSCEKELTNQVEFYDSNFFGYCFGYFEMKDGEEMIITDNKSYQKFGESVRIHSNNSNCESTTLPFIDFKKHTLIGKLTTNGGCHVNYDRQIIDDRKNKRIIYNITVEEIGFCKVGWINMNWALIPKLSNDYKVEFNMYQLRDIE